MRIRLAIVALAAGAPILVGPSHPAQAYVRGVSDEGTPLYWSSSCAAVTIYLNGFSMMTPDEVGKSIAAAAHAWSPAEVTCPGPVGSADAGAAADAGGGHPYFEIVPSLSTGGSVPPVAYDGKNSIIFQTQWKENPEAIAFTSHFSLPNGAIVDTDMEINASPESGIWANLDTGTPPPKNGEDRIDLQTAITHEFGHFIGLAHTCFNAGVDLPGASTDDQGQPVPACPDDLNFNCPVDPVANSDVPQAQSVMWFSVCHESTTKRVLSPDDVRAICDIYPAAQDPHACTLNGPDDGCGCATGGGRGTWGVVPSLLALGVAAVRARSFRRFRSDRARRAAPGSTSRRG
jgi:hypothetical protein